MESLVECVGTFLLVMHNFEEIKGEEAVIFDRQRIGVILHPYLLGEDFWKNYSIESGPERNSYTIESVNTMLELVSTKFSKVLTTSLDAHDVPYTKNDTYYNGADVSARIAELAASINRRRNDLLLTVMIGTNTVYRSNTQIDTEIKVALEAAEIAHSIFPGTIEGFALRIGNSLAEMNAAKQYIQTIRIRAKSLGSQIQIGLWYKFCDTILDETEVLVDSDMVICSTFPERDTFEDEGATAAFNSIEAKMLTEHKILKSINDNIDVMWCTGVNTEESREVILKSSNDGICLDKLRDYWLQVDKFATQHNKCMWMVSGIGTSELGIGWWTLLQQDLINFKSGYVETYLRGQIDAADPKIGFEENQTSWKYGAIFIGAMFIITLIGIVTCKIYGQWNLSKFGLLTRQEINDFKHGILDNTNEVCDASFLNGTALKLPYNRLLEIPEENLDISFSQFLGGGEFGCVYRAVLRNDADNHIEVALKMTKPNSGTEAIKGFLSEIKVLSYLGNHPNIVPIVGACTSEIHRGRVYVATELCPRGSLLNLLKTFWESENSSNISVAPVNDMIRWSYEIACGMEYLEEKRVIHADLATRNVLLSLDSVAKITDFGLSRRLYEYTNYKKTTEEPLPWRWMAYESLKSMEFSSKSDVWSYGITLWEIFSLGTQPYPGLAWTSDFVEDLLKGLRLMKPRYAALELFEVMEKCWILDTDRRPSFTELKDLVRFIQTNAMDNEYTTLVEGLNEANLS